MTRITDDNSNSTDYEFDKLNRLTKETFEDTETVIFEYDNAGNLITKTDQLGNEFVHSYDAMNRLTKKGITRAGGINGTTAQAFYFDALGRMTKATDDNGSLDDDDSEVIWYYDKASRVTRESQTVGEKTTRNVDSEYDDAGNRTKITYPSAAYLELSYDNVNNMTRIYDGSTTHASYEYSAVTLVTKKTLGTSTAVDLEVYYDNGYRITKYDWVQSSSTLVGFTYGYDDAENKNYQEVLHASGLDELYEYDNAHRLTNFKKGDLNVAKDDITSPARTQTYELDGLGNWTRVTTDGNSEDRTVNSVNEYTQIRTTSNTHDDNGNLTDDGTLEYEFDALNRLIKVVKKSDSSTIAEIAYDALNRRVWREADEDKNGSTEIDKIYIWDGYRNIAEYDYSGDSFIQEYYFGPMYLDEAVATYDGSNTYYYTTNHLFTTAALLNSSGNVVEWYDYDPYGKVTIYTGAGVDTNWFTSDDTTSTIPAQGSYLTFTGKPWDPESETTYHINRYMSHSVGASGYAERGRWLTRDPLGYVDTMNLYIALFAVNGLDAWGLADIVGAGGGTFDYRICCCPKEDQIDYILIGSAGSKSKNKSEEFEGIGAGHYWGAAIAEDFKDKGGKVVFKPLATVKDFKEAIENNCTRSITFIGHGVVGGKSIQLLEPPQRKAEMQSGELLLKDPFYYYSIITPGSERFSSWNIGPCLKQVTLYACEASKGKAAWSKALGKNVKVEAACGDVRPALRYWLEWPLW